MATTVKWRDREVKNPVLRVVLSICVVLLAVPVLIFGIVVGICTMIVLTPVHPLCRLLGLRGFWRGDGKFIADHTSFEVKP